MVRQRGKENSAISFATYTTQSCDRIGGAVTEADRGIIPSIIISHVRCRLLDHTLLKIRTTDITTMINVKRHCPWVLHVVYYSLMFNINEVIYPTSWSFGRFCRQMLSDGGGNSISNFFVCYSTVHSSLHCSRCH